MNAVAPLVEEEENVGAIMGVVGSIDEHEGKVVSIVFLVLSPMNFSPPSSAVTTTWNRYSTLLIKPVISATFSVLGMVMDMSSPVLTSDVRP